MKPSGCRLLFVGKFSITISISVLGLFIYFLFLTGSVLGDCTLLRTCPFLPDCPFYWHTVVHSSLIILGTSVQSVVSFFISNLTDLSPLTFFLDESAEWFISLVYLFQEPAFSLIDLCYCFLCLYFISFCSDLYDFLPSTNFRCCLFFFL